MKVKLAYFYLTKLFSPLKYIINKYNNIIKLVNKINNLLNIQLFFYINYYKSIVYFCSKSYFIFSIKKYLNKKFDKKSYILEFLFVFNEILTNIIKNNCNVSIITYCII